MRKRMLLFTLLFALLALAACQDRAESDTPPTPTTESPLENATPDETETSTVDEATGQPAGESPTTEGGTSGTVDEAVSEAIPEVADEQADVDPTGQTVMLWHPFGGTRQETLAELIDAFNSANEHDITVVAESLPPEGQDLDGTRSELSDGVHLLVVRPDQMAALDNGAAFVDLSPYLDSATSGLTEESRAALITLSEEPHYALPLYRAAELLYYNADLLSELGYDAPPSDWESFGEMACAASEAEQLGYLLDYRTRAAEAGHFATLLFSYGAELIAEDSTFGLESEEAVEALEFLQELWERGCIQTSAEHPGEARRFGEGTLLFATDSSARFPIYQSAVEEGYGGEWGVAPLPQQGADPVLNLSGADVALLESTPEQQLAAWLFLKWLLEPDQQRTWITATGDLPMRQDVPIPLDEYLAESPDYSSVVELLPMGSYEPTTSRYYDVRLIIEEGVAQIIEGANVAETLEDLAEEVNVLLLEQ